jgi:hypothetical protein
MATVINKIDTFLDVLKKSVADGLHPPRRGDFSYTLSKRHRIHQASKSVELWPLPRRLTTSAWL